MAIIVLMCILPMDKVTIPNHHQSAHDPHQCPYEISRSPICFPLYLSPCIGNPSFVIQDQGFIIVQYCLFPCFVSQVNICPFSSDLFYLTCYPLIPSPWSKLITSFLIAAYYSIVYTDHKAFIHLSAVGHLDCFPYPGHCTKCCSEHKCTYIFFSN